MNYRTEIKAYAREKLHSQYGTTLGATVFAFLPVFIACFATFFLLVIAIALLYLGDYTSVILSTCTFSFAELTIYATYLFSPFFLVGLSAFMLSAVRGKREGFTYPYRSGAKKYGRKLGGFLLQFLFISLWVMLFLIPGIVKSYSYSFNQYILADCPNLTARQALNLSKKMTNGIKGELFMFDLSFIGWWLLTVLTGGILSIYFVPYYLMAKATLYESMKNTALETGKIYEEELYGYESNC